MARSPIACSAVIHAPPHIVYGIIADYREGHPRILPRPPFVSLAVEDGGTGAGTLIRVEMRVLGRRQSFRARVAEPEPGRVLREANDTGDVTTFTVQPRAGGQDALVTIATEMNRPGPLGTLQRWAAALLLRPVYDRELELLAQEAARRVAGPSS